MSSGSPEAATLSAFLHTIHTEIEPFSTGGQGDTVPYVINKNTRGNANKMLSGGLELGKVTLPKGNFWIPSAVMASGCSSVYFAQLRGAPVPVTSQLVKLPL